jgi:hypothetical protein
MAGVGNAASEEWLEKGAYPTVFPGFGDTTARLYAMSDTLTVVPEPSTILIWLGFSGVAGLIYWRKRRS